MEGETIISWTPANWITITLMVFLSFTVIGAITHTLKNRATV